MIYVRGGVLIAGNRRRIYVIDPMDSSKLTELQIQMSGDLKKPWSERP